MFTGINRVNLITLYSIYFL